MKQLKNEWVFNSINELVKELDNSEELEDRDNSSDKDEGRTWCDTRSYKEAREQLLYGKEIDELKLDVSKYNIQGHGEHRKIRQSVAGFNVIVPLYLQGIPNSMITHEKRINNKIVNLFYSIQAPHYVDSDNLIKGATNLLKHIIELEKQGYRVNLYIVEAQGGLSTKFGFALRLKTDREVLNIKKMVFPLVSSSMLRRINFRIKERLYKNWIGVGYGSGIFNYNNTDSFIKRNLKIRNYEIWNYQGKQED